MNDRKKILTEIDKGLSRSKDALTLFFRQLLVDGGVNIGVWSNLMNKYLRDPANGIRQNTKTISSESGNLCKALLNNDTMTWRTFTKAVRLLSYNTPYIRLELHYKISGRPMTVSKIVLVDRAKEIDLTKDIYDNSAEDVEDLQDKVIRLEARVAELEAQLAAVDKPPSEV